MQMHLHVFTFYSYYRTKQNHWNAILNLITFKDVINNSSAAHVIGLINYITSWSVDASAIHRVVEYFNTSTVSSRKRLMIKLWFKNSDFSNRPQPTVDYERARANLLMSYTKVDT